MAAIASLNLSTPRALARTPDSAKAQSFGSPCILNQPWKRWQVGPGRIQMRPMKAAPEGISEKVEKSIKEAEEACAGDPVSGECVAAWDEVEELSAAASHAREKKKASDSDPLEEFCKENPETVECRTYED
ncbi:calvin cycle protein CP12-1, chloroplastic-like [Tripterygium wilfordii]|uniref:calvin cycle protein CP12-1, chloroplastic-like n=1 Tax=Tripterygium wilfordii TaxID=458696 RepID=UPI0018F7ECFA|nr:calvin cycle protein CP12-1, chloroplastic-like [Tripterygium wilfordii]